MGDKICLDGAIVEHAGSCLHYFLSPANNMNRYLGLWVVPAADWRGSPTRPSGMCPAGSQTSTLPGPSPFASAIGEFHLEKLNILHLHWGTMVRGGRGFNGLSTVFLPPSL